MQVHEQYEKLRDERKSASRSVSHRRHERAAPHTQAVRKGASVVVATPGRLEESTPSRNWSIFAQVKILVLDESDRMLDMGFLPAIRRIVAALPR